MPHLYRSPLRIPNSPAIRMKNTRLLVNPSYGKGGRFTSFGYTGISLSTKRYGVWKVVEYHSVSRTLYHT